MIGNATVRGWSPGWTFVLYVAAGGSILALAAGISGGDLVESLYFLVIVPIISLFLLVVAIRKKQRPRLAAISALALYCAVSWVGLTRSTDVRNASRWFLWSKDYKAQVLAQSESVEGELKHIEWDGWGGRGASETIVYLVFDPLGSLSAAARSASPVKVIGIPCMVPNAHRLEDRWYLVVFYADETWGQCS